MKFFLITLLASLSFGYAANSPKAEAAQSPPKQEQKQEKSYWVTKSTGKIHNSSCRWYGKSKGSASAKPEGDEGRDCKICGGRKK